MAKENTRFPRILKKGLLTAVEEIASPEIRKQLSKYLIAGLFLVAILQAFALTTLFPLKEYIPYFLAEQADGSLQVSSKVGKRFVASDVNKSYYLRKFIDGTLIIDEQTRFRLPEVANFIKGAAVTQWKEFVNQIDRPLAKLQNDPTLRRSVEYDGRLEFLASDDISGTVTAFLVVKTIGKSVDKVSRIKMRMDYVMLPITDEETTIKNPIGIYVTNFGIENVE